jgi:mono/diheme cytochrome c family protein
MKNVFVSLLLAIAFICQASAQKQIAVTPVGGESWLSHLHRALQDTSMGKTGRLGPPTVIPVRVNTMRAESMLSVSVSRRVTLQGADLYRLNCRGCHGESGQGAPPEIASVLDASRATYAQFTLDRLNKLGMQTTRAEANELANQAKGALLDRLHKGGVDMPPFPHLSDSEVHAIFAYLRQLAKIPGAQAQQIRLEEEPVRIGEHIVKSTCHTCHSAAGVNPNSDELMQGAIPPLSTLTTRVGLPEFERKVRHGAPIMMGTPVLPYRGRMPVFDYLSESEVADAYLYLKMFPPSAWTDPVIPPDPPQTASAISAIVSNHEPPHDPPHGQAQDKKGSALPILAEIFVGLLVVGGAVFTLYDVKRSRAKGRTFRALTGDSLAALPTQRGPLPLGVPAGSSRTAKRAQGDTHKQAACQSRFRRTEYHLFESSWLSRRWENEDGAA